MSGETFQNQIAFIVSKINIEIPKNGKSSIGTGFFYIAPLNDGTGRTITLLISNKHVFVEPTGKLTIILNQKDGNGNPKYGDLVPYEIVNFEGAYYAHPNIDVDLACVNASEISHTNSFYMSLDSEFLKEIDYRLIAPGSHVIFVGYPENRYDMVHNLPLIRKGSIASVPEVDFNGKGQIVIDAQVFQGSSGSPVFVAVGGHYRLLGVVSETMIRHAQLQTLPANAAQVGVQQILGLGIIIKQKHVLELIDYAVSEFIRRNSSAPSSISS